MADVRPILDRKCAANPLPPDFFKAIGAIEKFSSTGLLYSRNESLHSHPQEGVGASFECPGVPPNLIFSARQMGLTKAWAETIDFFAKGSNEIPCFKIFGKNIRAVIAGISE